MCFSSGIKSELALTQLKLSVSLTISTSQVQVKRAGTVGEKRMCDPPPPPPQQDFYHSITNTGRWFHTVFSLSTRIVETERPGPEWSSNPKAHNKSGRNGSDEQRTFLELQPGCFARPNTRVIGDDGFTAPRFSHLVPLGCRRVET